MENLSIAVCDRNEEVREQISEWIGEVAKKWNVAIRVDRFESIKEFCLYYERGIRYDMVFLDVIQPKRAEKEMLKIFLVKQLQDKSTLVDFITNSKEERDALLEWQPLNVRIKPLTKKDVVGDLGRAYQIWKLRNVFLTYTRSGNLYRVPLQEITHFQEKKNAVVIHTLDRVYHAFHGLLDDVEIEYESANFVRCNSTYVVNKNCIVEVRDSELLLRNGMVLPVDKDFLQRFGE